MADKNNLDIFKEKTDNLEYIAKLLPEVFMSNGDVQKFNPKNIIESIIREAGLSRKDAKIVTELVVRRIIASGIKFLSGPHIRELVCSALSELNFEEERKKFTRIGMPIHDYETLLQSQYNERSAEYTVPENIHRWAADQLASEYTLLKLLTNDQTRSHLAGDLHIHSIRYFDMKPYSQSWDLRMILKQGLPPVKFLNSIQAKPAKNATTAILHASRWLSYAHSEFAGEQSYLYFNIFIAPYLKGLKYEEIKQLAQRFIFETNQLFIAHGSHIPVSSIICSPSIPNQLKKVKAVGPSGIDYGIYEDYEEESTLFCNALSDVYKEGDGNGRLFSFPKHKIILDSDQTKWLGKDFFINSLEESAKMGTSIYINTNSSWLEEKGYYGEFFSNLQFFDYLKQINDEEIFDWSKNYINLGALQSISINLPRIIYESKHNESKLEEILLARMDIAKEILLRKRDLVNDLLKSHRLPICSSELNEKPLLNMKRQALLIGFVGLNEMVKAYTGFQLHEDKSALEFGKKILKLMVDRCISYTKDNNSFFTLWEHPAEYTTHRFAVLDIEHFHDQARKIVKGDIQSGAVYYTPSAHVTYNTDLDFSKKLEIHSQLGEILQNNNSLPIWLNNAKNNEDIGLLKTKVIELMNKNISEFSFNFDYSLCQNCGLFVKDILKTCPTCGNRNVKPPNILSKITDYYSPLELFNKGKHQEFKDRKRISF